MVRELTGSRWGGMAAGIVYAAAPVLCQNSALLKQTINQQLSVCVCDRTKGRSRHTIVWPEGVIFRSMMTHHVQFLLARSRWLGQPPAAGS